jgi:hypothetical protein
VETRRSNSEICPYRRLAIDSPFVGHWSSEFGVWGSLRATTNLPQFHIHSDLCVLCASVVNPSLRDLYSRVVCEVAEPRPVG